MELTKKEAVSVEARDLSKAYSGDVVLDHINFSVEPGEIFVIMGPSRAGKSVLLRHIAGLDIAQGSGEVLIDGNNAADPHTFERINMALVFQAGALFSSLSVYDNLAFYPREHRLWDEAMVQQKIFRILEILNLVGSENKMPSELSGGMRKRVSIARALVMEPQLLLYDEPTSELDPVTAANITRIIRDLKKEFGVTSIVVSHDRELALTIADRVAFLMDGELVTIATPNELKASKSERINQFLYPLS